MISGNIKGPNSIEISLKVEQAFMPCSKADIAAKQQLYE